MYLISSHFDSLKAFSKACNNKQTQPFVIYVRYLQYFCLSRQNFTRFASLFPAFPVFHHIFAHASKIIPPIRPWNNFSRTIGQNISWYTAFRPSWPVRLLKSCVSYSFASLFFKSKTEHLWNLEKCFLFTFKSSSCSRENQILKF